MPMQPRPRAETARAVPFSALPSVRVERVRGVVMMRACAFERTRSQGLRRTEATLVQPDLVLDRLEVLLDVRELREHALAVGAQEREPLHLVPVTRAAQVRVRADLADRHPGPADLPLVIEVADSSLSTDRSTKQRLYATAGVAQYWLINLPESQVEVHKEPDSATGKYADQTILKQGQTVSWNLSPAQRLDISVADLFR